MKNDDIEKGRSLVLPGYRTAPEIDRGDKSGSPLILALVRYGRAPQAALLDRRDHGRGVPTVLLTTAADAAEAAGTLDAGPDRLDNYILALGHWRAMGAVAQPVLVPESLQLHQVRTLVGDYEVTLWVWATDETSAAWMAGTQARASAIGNAEARLIKRRIDDDDAKATANARA